MKIESLKKHLKSQSIYGKRRTTINHAFAAAIAPADKFDPQKIIQALKFLKQDPKSDLICEYCRKPAETWDHLTGLVKDGAFRGFGHQIGNLVPACGYCNSKKRGQEFAAFILSNKCQIPNKNQLIRKLTAYQRKFSKQISVANLQRRAPKEYEQYNQLKEKMLRLMQRADTVANTLREKILK